MRKKKGARKGSEMSVMKEEKAKGGL